MTGSGSPGPKAPRPSHKLVEERPIRLRSAGGSPARGENGCAYCGAELLT